jgi:LytS/YehU family sensor histidine kinase
MPPLLLQPLVENAIKHGLEPKVEGGSITVRARHADGRLMLEVLDTGVGPATDHATVDGFGLTQVRDRLATAYGKQGVFKLLAGHTMGTRARATFPCET